jgi:hypothetical protein
VPDPVRFQWMQLPSRAAVRDIACAGDDVFVACAVRAGPDARIGTRDGRLLRVALGEA